MTVLQVALDLLDLETAVKIAEQALKAAEDANARDRLRLEVGTPLVKSAGMEAVKRIRERFPESVIVVDMKTMDTGRLEAEMALRAGGNVVCVLGVAPDETIKEAVLGARDYGGKVMVDLIGAKDPVKRAREVAELGVDIIGVHVGIDEQMLGKSPVEILRDVAEIKSERDVLIAVAGGLTPESIPDVVSAGADIVIVGSYITKSRDPYKATRECLEAIKGARIPVKRKRRTAEEIRKVFETVSTPNIADAMKRRNVIVGLRPVVPGLRAIGPAFTVRTAPGDRYRPVKAIDMAPEGSVLVIDAGDAPIACRGELATRSAKNRKLSGVVIFGGIRDVEVIRELRFPAFATHIVPHAGEPKGFGEVNVPLEVRGVIINPGDRIVADDNGMIVIPRERLVEVANRAFDVREKEEAIRREIESGKTLGEVMRMYIETKRGRGSTLKRIYFLGSEGDMRLDQRVPELFEKFKGLGRSRPLVELAGVEAAILPPSDEPRFLQIKNRLEEARVLDEQRDIRVIDTQPGYYVIASSYTLDNDGALALPPDVEPESVADIIRIIHDAREIFRDMDADAFVKGEPENKYVKVLVQYVKTVKEQGEGVHVHLDTYNVHAYELKVEDPFKEGYKKIVNDIADILYAQALEGEIKAEPVSKIIESPGAIAFAAYVGKDTIMHIIHFGYGKTDPEAKKKLEIEKMAFDALRGLFFPIN